MAELSERHEVRVHGKDSTIVFSADSSDGKLVIRQEWDGKGPKESGCSITLSNPEELRGFFKGLRRIMASLGTVETGSASATATVRPKLPPQSAPSDGKPDSEEREALIAKARTRNAQAFAPWSRAEEQEIARRYKAGDSIEIIARDQKRSPRAIELRLQKLGLVSGGS